MMKSVLIGTLTFLVVCVGMSQGAWSWNAAGTMVYDGLGADSAINPKEVTGAEAGADINIANGTGGVASLTVQSGTLTIKAQTSWGDKIGHMPGSGTPAYDYQGAIAVNGGTLNWYINNDNEDRMMFGNNIRNGKSGRATVTLNGGAFNITGDATFDHAERQVRFGSDGGVGNLVLNAGTMTISINLPFAFGDKWVAGGTTWTASASPSVSTMTINNGSLVCSGSSIFGVGTNDNINFITGGTGMLSILNWKAADFLALATAGKLQVDGVDVTDLSSFTVVDGTATTQGILSLNSKVKAVAPLPGSTNVGIDQDLIWDVLDTNVTYLDVWFGTDPNWVGHPVQKVLSHVAATTETYEPGTLAYSTTYYWKVDAYEPNGVGEIKTDGGTWSFTTVGQAPSVSAVNPAKTVVDAGQTVVLSVTGTNVVAYQWYKIGTLTDTQLTNGTKYAGVTTDTLTINGIVQADEGYYYCSVRNTVYPDAVTNKTTGPGHLMTKRLMSYYPMNATTVVDSNSVTPDIVGGFNAVLKQEGTAGLPTLAAGVPELGGNGLSFNNTDHATDPNGQYAQIGAGVVNYDDITIELWAKWNGGAAWQRIFDFGNNTTQYMFLTPNNGTEARFVLKNGGAEQIVSTSPLSTGQWIHLVMTLSANTGRLYINGELKATNTGVTINPIDINSTLNYVGKSQWPDPEFDGMLDDLKIYNYARTTTEIAQDYLAVKGGWVCNTEGTVDLTYDFDHNCQVDLGDFALLAAKWLNSNRIYPN